jgi:hypothetical protein
MRWSLVAVNTSPFTVEEIDELRVVFRAAVTAATEKGFDVPIAILLARAAASTGERDPEKLKGAVLNSRRKDSTLERRQGGLGQ